MDWVNNMKKSHPEELKFVKPLFMELERAEVKPEDLRAFYKLLQETVDSRVVDHRLMANCDETMLPSSQERFQSLRAVGVQQTCDA